MDATTPQEFHRGQQVTVKRWWETKPTTGMVWEDRGDRIVIMVNHRAARGGTWVGENTVVRKADVQKVEGS